MFLVLAWSYLDTQEYFLVLSRQLASSQLWLLGENKRQLCTANTQSAQTSCALDNKTLNNPADTAWHDRICSPWINDNSTGFPRAQAKKRKKLPSAEPSTALTRKNPNSDKVLFFFSKKINNNNNNIQIHLVLGNEKRTFDLKKKIQLGNLLEQCFPLAASFVRGLSPPEFCQGWCSPWNYGTDWKSTYLEIAKVGKHYCRRLWSSL